MAAVLRVHPPSLDGALLGEVVVRTATCPRERVAEDVVEILGVAPGDAVLELGCGSGRMLSVVAGRLREGGPVIFDETIHGYYLDPNLLKAMFQFPLVFVTTAAVATIAVLLWAATGRFGAPARVEPPLRMGKATLVAAGADMLSSGRHESPIADRYRKVVLDEVGRRIHAPLQAHERTLGTWLDRVGQARGVRRKFTELWQGFDVPPGSGSQQSRLLLQRKAEEAAERKELAGDIKASWGDQMRSYVLQPYQMVKDLRTEHEVGNPDKVFDGDIDEFIEAGIRWRKAQEKADAGV